MRKTIQSHSDGALLLQCVSPESEVRTIEALMADDEELCACDKECEHRGGAWCRNAEWPTGNEQ
jgi:hypothetical protein